MKNKFILVFFLFFMQYSFAQTTNDSSDLFSRPYKEDKFSIFSMNNSDDEILSPKEAFKFQYQIRESSVHILFDIAKDHYVYRDKIELKVDGVKVDNINEFVMWPQSSVVSDPNFGSQNVFKGQVDISISKEKIGSTAKELELLYYGCSPKGICYSPEIEKISMLDNNGYVSIIVADQNSNKILFNIGLAMLLLIFLIFTIFWKISKPKIDVQ